VLPSLLYLTSILFFIFFFKLGKLEGPLAMEEQQVSHRFTNIMFTQFIEDEYDHELLDPSLWVLAEPRYVIYQLERCPETNRLHYQGYIEFVKQQNKRFVTLQEQLEGLETAHFERRRGTREQAIAYCSKADTKVDGPYIYGEVAAGGQGARTDLMEIKRKLDDGVDLETIRQDHFGSWLRYGKRFSEYRRLATPKRDWPMELIVMIGPSGTGKSRYCRETYPLAYWKDEGQWWEDYAGQETVIVDEMYGHRFTYSMLLRLCDRYPMKVECKGSAVEFTSRRIVFTSNAEPWDWYDLAKIHQRSWEESPLNRRFREFGRIVRTGPLHQAVARAGAPGGGAEPPSEPQAREEGAERTGAERNEALHVPTSNLLVLLAATSQVASREYEELLQDEYYERMAVEGNPPPSSGASSGANSNN